MDTWTLTRRKEAIKKDLLRMNGRGLRWTKDYEKTLRELFRIQSLLRRDRYFNA